MTSTYRQLLIAVLQAAPRLTVALVLVPPAAALMLAVGDTLQVVSTLLGWAVLTTVVLLAPRRALARGGGSVAWTIDGDGLRLTTAVSDVRLAWSQVRQVAGRRSVLVFRTSTAIPLPRRCTTPQQLAAIEVLARAAGVRSVFGVVRHSR